MGLALGRARAANAASAGDVGGEERRGSGVNEMNSRRQTGPSGGVCAGPPFWLPPGRLPAAGPGVVSGSRRAGRGGVQL